MVRAGEDLDELGGYFIINGNERVLRFVIQQKTNYPIALKRESFRNREIFATDLAILLRSQRQAVHHAATTAPGDSNVSARTRTRWRHRTSLQRAELHRLLFSPSLRSNPARLAQKLPKLPHSA